MTRTRRTIIAAMLFTALAATQSMAQTSGTPLEGPRAGDDFYQSTYFAIGANLGFTSGCGLSGRVSVPGGFSVQATGFIITAFDYLHFNMGLEAQYAFDRNDNGRLYGLLGFGYFDSARQDSAAKYPGNRIAEPVRIGLGPGYEWFLSKRSVLSISLPISILLGGDKTKVFPIPQIGFFYYFR